MEMGDIKLSSTTKSIWKTKIVIENWISCTRCHRHGIFQVRRAPLEKLITLTGSWWLFDHYFLSRPQFIVQRDPDSKVHGANMGPIWGRQDPAGPHVGPMNFAIWGPPWYFEIENSLSGDPLDILRLRTLWILNVPNVTFKFTLYIFYMLICYVAILWNSSPCFFVFEALLMP